ncbi:ATP-binding cassette domain-containing protein [Williamsia sp. CHRR-6]|uniref:ABC transporter ATP-binding protein n=1 Tax=Williamsia sp. CHRR-6 TaxID=2835871 RepID=UPI001BDA1C17|nr:ATP-binding cassette domain-containing protein [Williamsia sp. CHRR-6]MBT0565814.1 ABC transporter ATP-binding protein [Williamsia sp. CHRR-6]
MLSINKLSVEVNDRPLIDNLSIDAHPGQIVCVTGANGTGKTTLLEFICGLRQRSSSSTGSITVDGIVADDTDRHFRQLVAFDLGEDATFAELTVVEHLRLIARLWSLSDDAAEVALADCGLVDHADRLPHNLSRGQRHRFDLASAFLRPAAVIVLDEPESALDIDGRAWLIDSLLTRTRRRTTVVMASHAPDLQAIADIRIPLGPR